MQIAYTRRAFKSVGINEDEYISTEYQYRESNHILFETEDYWFLYTQSGFPSFFLSFFLSLFSELDARSQRQSDEF